MNRNEYFESVFCSAYSLCSSCFHSCNKPTFVSWKCIILFSFKSLTIQLWHIRVLLFITTSLRQYSRTKRIMSVVGQRHSGHVLTLISTLSFVVFLFCVCIFVKFIEGHCLHYKGSMLRKFFVRLWISEMGVSLKTSVDLLGTFMQLIVVQILKIV